MAGEVEIKGGGDLDGAVLRNAATESTLKELVAALNAKSKGSGNKIMEMHEKVVKNNITAMNNSTGSMNAYENTLSTLNKGSSKLAQKFSEIAGMAVGGLFSGIVGAGRMLLGFFTDSLDSFRQTSQVGATFNNDLVELRRTAAAAAMPLDMFTEMIGKNSQILAAFGGTVTNGAKRFADLSSDLRTSQIGTQLLGMGMTMGDLNQYMADYLNLEMRTGRLEGRTNAELLQGTQNYIMEMDKLTKITGLSRQQQSDALRAAMRDGRILQLQSRLSGESLNRFRSAVTLMQTNLDPQAMGSITNMMAGVIDPTDQFAKKLTALVPGVMDFNRALGQGQLTTEQVVQGARDQIAAIDRQLAGMTDEQIARDQDLSRLRQYQESLRALARANTAEGRAEQARRNAITQALGSFSQTIEKIKGDIMVALIDSGVFKRIEEGLQEMARVFLENKDKIGPAIAKLIEEVDQFFTRFLDKVKTDGIAGAIGDFLKGLLARAFGRASPEQQARQSQNTERLAQNRARQQQLREAMAQSNTSLTAEQQAVVLPDMQRQLDELARERETLVAENNSIEDSLRNGLFSFDWKTIGLAIGGVVTAMAAFTAGSALFSRALTSMAPGLTSLTPAIPVILSFGAAIGMGAGGLGLLMQGISSVIEQAAKAFDMLPTSLKKFEDLNPDALRNVGRSLQDLSGPLVASGFAGVLSSIGGDGLPKLANAVKMFEDVNPEKIRDVGPALEVLNRGLAALTGGAGGGVLQAFGGAISRFLTGDNGLGRFADSFKKFNEIDANNIRNLVSGLDDVKNKIGEDFNNQARNVDSFATSIRRLRTDLEALRTTLDALSRGTGFAGSGTSALAQVATQIGQIGGGGAGGATNAMLEEQKKLNTLITELKPIFEETRDATKDVADSTSGRRRPL